MRRVIVLGALVLVGGLSAAASRQPAAQEMVVTVEKVKDNLYVLRGGGRQYGGVRHGRRSGDCRHEGDRMGQTVAREGQDADRQAGHHDHQHPHTLRSRGWQRRIPATVDIVTHEKTKTLMTQMNDVTGFGPQANVFKDNPGKGQPKRTFKDKLTIGKGADRIDLFYFGRAHTGGDAFVVFPALRVMHVGDTFPFKALPIMDKNNGGSGVDYPTTLTNAVTNVKDVDIIIINGHTPANTTLAELREYPRSSASSSPRFRQPRRAGRRWRTLPAAGRRPRIRGYPAAIPIASRRTCK